MAPQVPAALRGDPGRIRQMLLNLADALSATEYPGTTTIRLDVRPLQPPSASTVGATPSLGADPTVAPTGVMTLHLTVTGPGAGVRRDQPGANLRLTISRLFVELMGGEFVVEQPPDAPRTIHVVLPTQAGADAIAQSAF